jgi:hypothetical protein
MIFKRWTKIWLWGGLTLLLVLPGCLLVGRTEHRIEVLGDGSARVRVRYIDLRSDGETDSAAARDMDILLDSFTAAGRGEHLPSGMRLLGKRLILEGDTLVAEVELAAPNLGLVEGVALQEGRPTVVVPAGEQITWTNGAISRWRDGGLRIQWSGSATHLGFDVQPVALSATRSLAPLYRRAH